jgi:hypothetical protein
MLHEAPFLLPTHNTAMRRELEKWFVTYGVEPLVVGEFEDAALAKIAAAEGYGVTAVPTLVENEAVHRYGFVPIGRTTECGVRLYLVTAERTFAHPGEWSFLRGNFPNLRKPSARPARSAQGQGGHAASARFRCLSLRMSRTPPRSHRPLRQKRCGRSSVLALAHYFYVV